MTAVAGTTITERLHALASARRSLALLVDEKKLADGKFALEQEPLLAKIKDAKATVEQESAAVRSMGLVLYHADPANKKPAAGLTVKVMTGIVFDAVKALGWAKEKNIALNVSLDEKAFKAIAPSLSDEDKERCGVKGTADAEVQIASDLDAALAVAEVTK